MGCLHGTTLHPVEIDEFVQAFGAAIEAGQASLMVGAGLSEDAGYPTWVDLLDPMAQRFDIPHMDDLPELAQFIENCEGGRDDLRTHVAQVIGSVVPIPQKNHELLARLGADAKCMCLPVACNSPWSWTWGMSKIA